MNDHFISEYNIFQNRKNNAAIRVAKRVKGCIIKDNYIEKAVNAIVFDGDAENTIIDSLYIKDSGCGIVMNNMLNSKISNVTTNNSSPLNIRRKVFKKSILIEKDDSKKAKSMGNYAMFLKTHLKFEEALNLLRSALNIFKEKNDEESISITYANIGIIFKCLKEYSLAMKCYELALLIDKRRDNKIGIIANYINIGIIHDLKNQSMEAIKKYKNCILLATGMSDAILDLIYENMSIAYSNFDSKII